MNISSKHHYIKNYLKYPFLLQNLKTKCSINKLKLQQKELYYLILFIQLNILFTNIYSTDTTKQLDVKNIVRTFHIAINENNVKEVKKLLIQYNNTDLDLANSQDSEKKPAIWKAAHDGYIDLVKLLTKYGTDKSTKHPNTLSTPFHVAALKLSRQQGNLDNLIKIIKYLNKHNFDIKSLIHGRTNNTTSEYYSILTQTNFNKNPDLYTYLIVRGVSLDGINLPEGRNSASDLIIKRSRDIDSLEPSLNNMVSYCNDIKNLEEYLITLDRSITLDDIELASKLIIDFKILDPIIEHYKNNLNNIDDSLWPKHQIDEWICDYINRYKPTNALDSKTLNYIIFKNILLKIQNKPNSQNLCYYLLDKISKQNIKLKSSKLKKLEHKFDTHNHLYYSVQRDKYTDMNIVTIN